MKFNVNELASVITDEIARHRDTLAVEDVGRVIEVGDGIAQIRGLAGVMASEMVEFTNGAIGQVFNLEENTVGVVILGDYLGVKEGDLVKGTGRLLSVPVGPALLGRVVDPLGRPLDEKGDRKSVV